MASNVLDSILFRDSFGTPAMRAVFDDHELIRKYVQVEIALAKAEARCGVIPAAAADEIAARCNADALDFDVLRHETEIVGYPILPLVHQISKQAGASGGYVHWGATTQDIMDTAVVLQLRDAFDLIDADIKALRPILAGLAKRYRDTPMAGRTHLQQALPVTFGYKVAIWLDMFDRHAERLAQARPRVLVGEFAGAAGTLASLGDKGLGGPESDDGRARPGRAGLDVARRARRICRGGEPAGRHHRIARQDRLRRHDHGDERVRRTLRAVRQRPRCQQHHAAEAQSDLQRTDAGLREGRASAGRR